MRLGIFFILCCLTGLSLFAQDEVNGNRDGGVDTTRTKQPRSLRELEKPKRERPPIDLYKIISIENDTTLVDTSLTIQKFYKYNYLRKDNFGLLSFANTGQTYNTLIHTFDERSLRPLFGARARHFNYMEVDDFKYYEVPTPWTELYYKSVFQQGQNLDAFFTMNTSRQFNFSIAYKGLRSLGKYQNILTSTGNFRFGFSYYTKDKRYQIRAHYVAQDLLNRENGGLTPQSLADFKSNDGQFSDRSRLEVNHEDAESILDGQRFFIDQHYDLIPQTDSTTTSSLQVGHRLLYSDTFFEFRQGSASTNLYGTSFVASDIKDKTDLEDFNNKIFARFKNPLLGTLEVQANHSFYDYGYNSVLEREGERIPNRLQGNQIALGANYQKDIGGFDFKSSAEVNVVGDFDGYTLNAEASYALKKGDRFVAGLATNSRPANYDHLLYQSSYTNYNWYNVPGYSNVKTSSLNAALESKRWIDASATLTSIQDYAYFSRGGNGFVNSFQSKENVAYLKIKAEKEFTYGHFSLANTVAYQYVSSGGQVFNVPQFVTRNTLYYSDTWFDSALFVQTGINFNYFDAYNMDGYDPVLAEFYVQNQEQVGGFPLIDIFFNMKVRQTRIFFIAEHVNSPFSNNEYFSAPGYPYRDFNFRFGLVWDFFL